MGNVSTHLIVLHAAAREMPGYRLGKAPSIVLEGLAIEPRSQRGRAITTQIKGPTDGTLEDELRLAIQALRHAGVPRRECRRAKGVAETYFYDALGLSGTTRTRAPKVGRRAL